MLQGGLKTGRVYLVQVLQAASNLPVLVFFRRLDSGSNKRQKIAHDDLLKGGNKWAMAVWYEILAHASLPSPLFNTERSLSSEGASHGVIVPIYAANIA